MKGGGRLVPVRLCLCQSGGASVGQSRLIRSFVRSLPSSPAPRKLSSWTSVKSITALCGKVWEHKVLNVRWEERVPGSSDF